MSRTIKKAKTGGKAVSHHCQNYGLCDYCRSNRTIVQQKEESKAVLKLKEYLFNATQEELDERINRIKALNLPSSPTLKELRDEQNY